MTTSTGTYSPPNWSQFTFGVQQPYWLSDGGPGGFGLQGDIGISGPVGGGFSSQCCFQQPENQKIATYTGRTDSTGTHYLQLNFDGQKPDLPVMVDANASVTDVNRQSFASNLEVLVHPSTLYVGIRSTRQFVREGEPIDVEGIVTDIDGNVVSGRKFTVTVSRVESQYENGSFVETDVDPKHCDVTSGKKPVRARSRPAWAPAQDLGGGRRRRRRSQPQRIHARL